jgi:hypothetical protein
MSSPNDVTEKQPLTASDYLYRIVSRLMPADMAYHNRGVDSLLQYRLENITGDPAKNSAWSAQLLMPKR